MMLGWLSNALSSGLLASTKGPECGKSRGGSPRRRVLFLDEPEGMLNGALGLPWRRTLHLDEPEGLFKVGLCLPR